MSVPGVEWRCLLFQIKVCETCRHAERSKNLARTVRPLKVEAPWDIVGIDFIGIYPFCPVAVVFLHAVETVSVVSRAVS